MVDAELLMAVNEWFANTGS